MQKDKLNLLLDNANSLKLILIDLLNKEFNVNSEIIFSQSRKKNIVIWRQILCYILYEYGIPPYIISNICNIERCSIYNSVYNVKAQIKYYNDIKEKVNSIKEKLDNIYNNIIYDYINDVIESIDNIQYKIDKIKKVLEKTCLYYKTLPSYILYKETEIKIRDRMLFYLMEKYKLSICDVSVILKINHHTIHKAFYQYANNKNKEEIEEYKRYVNYIEGKQ